MSPIPMGPAGLPVGVTALVPAAGRGQRLGGTVPKQFLELDGIPVIVRVLRLLAAETRIDEIVIAADIGELDRIRELVRSYGCAPVTRVVPGGEDRQQSVRLALAAVSSRPRIVLVHDAARPLLDSAHLKACLDLAATHPAVILAVTIADTLKLAAADTEPPVVSATVSRENLWAAQTPQVFHADLLAAAHVKAEQEGFQATDDAALMEHFGIPVIICPGSRFNIKITTSEDLGLAEAILARRGGGTGL